MKDLEINNLNWRTTDLRQVREEILRSIQEQETRLDVVKTSREEALVHLNEYNEARQKILEERRAILAE